MELDAFLAESNDPGSPQLERIDENKCCLVIGDHDVCSGNSQSVCSYQGDSSNNSTDESTTDGSNDGNGSSKDSSTDDSTDNSTGDNSKDGKDISSSTTWNLSDLDTSDEESLTSNDYTEVSEDEEEGGSEDDRRRVTYHWIFNGSEVSVYHRDIREQELLSYNQVRQILDTIEFCDERDELLMAKSRGWLSGRTSLHWVCRVATNKSSDELMKLIKLLLEKISDTNRKQFVETIRYSLCNYSIDVRRLLLDHYDGDVIKLSATPYPVCDDDVHKIVLDTIEDRFDDAQQALIKFCTMDRYGELLVHHLTAWREESLLRETLRRLSLQSRRVVLTYRDSRNGGVTPLYLSGHSHKEIREKILPGRIYYVDDISESLIRMFKFFCNEYCVTLGVNLMSYTINAVTDSKKIMLSTYASHHRRCIKGRSSDGIDVVLIIHTKYIENMESISEKILQNLLKDGILLKNYKYMIVLVQLVVRSAPLEKPNPEELHSVMSLIFPCEVVYWFLITCADLKLFIKGVLNCLSGLFSLDQQLAFTRHQLQRHESVIYVSPMQGSSTMDSTPLQLPVNISDISYVEISCEGDTSTLITHTFNAGSALIVFATVYSTFMDGTLVDLMSLPATTITSYNDTLPKVIFIQFLVKDANKCKLDPTNQGIKIKPFGLPTDCSVLFVYTVLDLRNIVSDCLTISDSTTLQQRLSLLRQRLTLEQSVIYVSAVYSSLGRRFTWMPKTEENDNKGYLSPPCKILKRSPLVGSALIIYMTVDRSCDENGKIYSKVFKPGDKHWRGELTNAEYILGRQLGLKLKSKKDLNTEETMKEVRNFAVGSKGDDYSVLAIMSHGDENDQIVAGDNTTLAVQDLVNAFSNYNSNPKIVILQYCRGPNRYSQLPSTYEEVLARKIIRGKPGMKETRIVPFRQRVVPPRNLFMVYSTSSDCRSIRGLLFKCMKVELLDIWKSTQYPTIRQPTTIDIIDMMTDVAGSVRDKSLLYQFVETVDTLCKPLHLHIYPYEDPDECDISEVLMDF